MFGPLHCILFPHAAVPFKPSFAALASRLTTTMPSSLAKIWIHAFYSTKNRVPLIHPSFESSLFAHIKEHLEQDFRCYLEAINGTPDHIHLLFLLNPNYSVKDILKNVKGESSHWINGHDFIESKFAWQKAYTAVSVSDSVVKVIARFVDGDILGGTTPSFLPPPITVQGPG